jgi:hypothetical protein
MSAVATRFLIQEKTRWVTAYRYPMLPAEGGSMKIDDIMIGKQVSKHLYHFDSDIEPEDLLKIMRFSAHKSRTSGYYYSNEKLFYTKIDAITKQEFEYIYDNVDKDIEGLLERFTREELISRLSSVMKITSSTTKIEIIQRARQNKNLLFDFFKKEFIREYCSDWYEFKKGKTFLTTVSDPSKNLVFTLNYERNSLSGKKYLQFWRLGNTCHDFELTRDFKTRICGDYLTINLEDSNDVIFEKMKEFLRQNSQETKLNLNCVYKKIDINDLDFKKADAIRYSLWINELSKYFGLRKGSKFKTFSEGLRQRNDTETVKNHLARRFIIASGAHDVYCGIEHDREFFERIAWHLKIEYLKDTMILCKVVEEETQETIAALWDLLNRCMYRAFCFVEL